MAEQFRFRARLPVLHMLTLNECDGRFEPDRYREIEDLDILVQVEWNSAACRSEEFKKRFSDAIERSAREIIYQSAKIASEVSDLMAAETTSDIQRIPVVETVNGL